MELITCSITSHVDSLEECVELARGTRLKLMSGLESSRFGESYKQIEFEGSIGDVCRFFYKLGNRKLYVFPS